MKNKKHNKKSLNRWKTISCIYILLFIATVILSGINYTNIDNRYISFIKEQNSTINNLSYKHKDEIEKAIVLNPDEVELLAKLLYHEGRGESFECQCAIISVVINRVESNNFPNNIYDVVYQKSQFEPVETGLINGTKPLQTQYDVINYIMENGTTIPSWVEYFRAGHHFNWSNYTKYMNMNNTYFGGYKGE